MATTDRINLPIGRRTITDRLGEAVTLGGAAEGSAFDMDAAAAYAPTSESEVFSAFSIVAEAVFSPVASYIEREYLMEAQASFTAVAESFAVATFDMDAAASLSIVTDATELEMRNAIINGNFDIWQRGTSLASGGGNRIIADRFKMLSSGTTYAASRQSFTVGQTDVPGEPTFFHRAVVSTVAGASNFSLLQHAIESVRTFAGQTVAVSFWAKADASKDIALEFVQSFGSGGSAFVTADVETFSLTSSWQKFQATVTLDSISGKTIAGGNDTLIVGFWFDAGSDFNARSNTLGQQSGTFDIAQVQLEAGSVVSPFEKRPLALELALCQRYYERAGDAAEQTYPASSILSNRVRNPGASASSVLAPIFYRVTKRAEPTVTYRFDINDASELDGTAAINSVDGFVHSVSVPAGEFTDINDWAADAEY